MKISRDALYSAALKLRPVDLFEIELSNVAAVIYATTEHHTASVTLDATGDGSPGVLTVESRPFVNLLTKLPRGSFIDLAADGALICGAFSVKLPLIQEPVERIAEPEKAEAFSLPAALLTQLYPFASVEETRYYCNGVSIQRGRVAATDGWRLVAVASDDLNSFSQSIIVHRETCKLLAKLGGEQLFASTDGKVAAFTAGAARVVAKLIDGTYPDIDRAIPTGHDTEIVVSASALIGAMARAGALSQSRNQPPAVIETHKDGLTVRSDAFDFMSSEDVPATVTGLAARIAFNANFARQFLPLLGGDELTLKLGGGDAPTKFCGTSENVTLVLMPMRVQHRLQKAA